MSNLRKIENYQETTKDEKNKIIEQVHKINIDGFRVSVDILVSFTP